MTPRLNTTGWVLSRLTKENDLRLTLLTPALGKIYATAKGAQKITSSRLGLLQPGNEVKLHLYLKGDYYWVNEAKLLFHFLQRPKNLTQINLLFYFLEIINALIPQAHADPHAYQIVTQIIKSIESDNFYLLINSEIKLIEYLGFGPPADITLLFSQKNLSACQKALNIYLQSIIERPLFSPQLFK